MFVFSDLTRMAVT